MDQSYILDEKGLSKLFIHAFHRELDDFFVVGLFEPAEGGVWMIADFQARLIASFIVAMASDPARADWFRKLKATANPDIGHGIPWKDDAWHRFEIQHYRFRKYMARLLRKFGGSATAPLAEAASTASAERTAAKAPLKLAS
jgi:hypothetical protein